MKKQFLLTAILFAVAMTVSAQLKVDSVGNVHVQNNVGGLAKLFVGETPGSIPDDYSCFKTGTYSQNYRSSNESFSYVGVYGSVEISPNISVNTTYHNYGVVGTIPVNAEGAGIVGTAEGSIPPFNCVRGSYAAYFFGDTYADGNLTVGDGLYNLSDMRLKKDVVSLRDNSRKSVLNDLKGLDVIEYRLNRPTLIYPKTGKKSTIHDKDSLRHHYGVSAQELQQIFPHLVKEGKDGYLTVNYTEMVPLLLRCIQELKQEVDDLRSEASEARIQTASLESNGVSDSHITTASLKQNTPNPFTERTTIRFTLPSDARDAYVYIFDMSGKMLKQLPVDSSMESVTVNGYELTPGMYIYSLVVNGKEMDTKKMILSK